MELSDLRLYLVRNADGNYYRRVGYHGYRECWTDDLNQASVWTKLQSARTRVTALANLFPDYPIPDLIEIRAGEIVVLDEKPRVEAKKEEKKRKVAQYTKWREEQRLKEAQAALAVAEENLKKLQERKKSP